MRKECVAKVEADLGRPLRAEEQQFIDRAIEDELTAAARRSRSTYKAMPYAQRVRQAGARASQKVRSYRVKGEGFSEQDRADIRDFIQRENIQAGAKLDVTLEDDLGGNTIAFYEDRALSFALNQVAGKTINGVMKAMQGTISHELLHWARSMGFYDDQQWAELVTAAKGVRMSKGDARMTGKLAEWQAVRDRLKRNPTYHEVATEVYRPTAAQIRMAESESVTPESLNAWRVNEEAAAIGMEVARSRYEQENPDPQDSVWRKGLGSLIRAGRALVKAIGTLAGDKQTLLRDYLEQQEANLRSGATAKQAPVFSPQGLEPAQKIKVAKIKPIVAEKFMAEEIEDLVRRVEDPNATAAQIAAAPIWDSLADKQEGPTINGEQTMDPEWWDKRQYPHPDGGDEMLTPFELTEYVRGTFEGRVKKVKQQRRAVIITGAPGAGKSSLSQKIADKAGAAVIDTDAVMDLIPEYNGGINAEDVWGEATALSQQATNWLIRDGSNIVHERIGDDIETLQKYTSRLREAGYKIDIVHVKADFTTRMRRMGARFLATGRPIPIDSMIEIGNNPTKTHRTAARMNLADSFYEVESGKGTDRRYRLISRSGKPSPGTSKGIGAAAGWGVARAGGRALFGYRPTPPPKELAVEYARLFQEWNKTAGYGSGAMANFGGVKAKGANLTALNEAKKMAAEGKDANSIRLKTGWFRPKDGKGKWRFALSSGDIRIKNPENWGNDKTDTLDDLIDTKLFDFYPSLKNVVVFMNNEGRTRANFLKRTIDIDIRGDVKEQLAHELQHIISVIEAFERGAATENIASTLRLGKGWEVNPPEWALRDAQRFNPNADNIMSRAFALYLAVVDEVQARDAERMVNMSAAERAAFEPTIMTQDTIRAEDIQNAWDHLRSIPLKLLAAIPPAGLTIYQLAHMLTNYFSAQSFKPEDAYNLPAVFNAAEQEEYAPMSGGNRTATNAYPFGFTRGGPTANSFEQSVRLNQFIPTDYEGSLRYMRDFGEALRIARETPPATQQVPLSALTASQNVVEPNFLTPGRAVERADAPIIVVQVGGKFWIADGHHRAAAAAARGETSISAYVFGPGGKPVKLSGSSRMESRKYNDQQTPPRAAPSGPPVHQVFGLTKAQSAKFDKMRAYAPVAKAMDAIGLTAAPKKITREQYAKLQRALNSISDEDFITDNMSASKAIMARRMVQQYLKDEKAFKVFLEQGVMDGGFVGTDRPSPVGPMEARASGRNGAPITSERWNAPEGVKLSERQRSMVEMAVNGASNEWIAEEWETDSNSVAVTLSRIKTNKLGGQAPWEAAEIIGKRDAAAVSIDRLVAARRRLGRGRDTISTIAEEFGLSKDNVRVRLWRYDREKGGGNAMESRKYTPPGGRFGATSSTTSRSIIGDQPGFIDDAAYVAAQLAAVPTTRGIGGTTIQDKRMNSLKPWNIAGGKLDELDKLAEGSLRQMWRHVFSGRFGGPLAPILQQTASKASRYFKFGGVPDQASLEIYRMLFQGRIGKAEELAAELARDVSKGLNISYQDAFKVLRGDMSGLAKLSQSVRTTAADQMYQLKKAMTESDPATQNAMISGGTVNGVTYQALPAELQTAGRRAMQAIREVGDALVEHRIISERQRAKFDGHYLLRAYMEHFDNYRPTMGTRASGALYRTWREGIPKDKRLTKGEIEDLPFLLYMSIERPLHDIAAYSYLNSLIHHNQTSPSSPRWFLPESLVLFGGKWRSLYYIANQRAQAQTSLENKKAELSSLGGTAANTQQARELRQEIRALEGVIQQMEVLINANPQYAAAMSKDELPKGYKQLPMETSRYGDAAGAIVMERLHDDITGGEGARADPETIPGKAQEMYTDFNRNVKFLLTVANPPTHLRNIYSNIIMLTRSGTNPVRVIEAVRDLADHYSKRRTSPAVEAALKFGAMKQTFTEAELRVLDEFARKLENEVKKSEFRGRLSSVLGPSQFLDKALAGMDTANAVLGAIKNTYGDTMSWFYQHEDVIFKIAKIADEIERGAPPAVAAMEARKYFFDYSAVTPVVRYLSNTAIAPFIRYTYFAVPNFLEQVATSPWRLAYTGYGQYIALMALASILWGFQPEDAKKTLNEYLEERPMLMPVPWRDEHGRIQWIDLGYTLPEGALWGLYSASVGGNPWEALRAFGMTGGPLATIYAGVSTGVDPFRGTPIYDETDDDMTQGLKMTWFSARSMMPSMYSYYMPPLPGEFRGGPGYEALAGTGTDRRGEPTQTGSQLIARALGVNVYPNDVIYGQQKRFSQMTWEIGELERDINRAASSSEYTEERRTQILEQLFRRMDQLLAERDEYITATSEAVEAESRRQREQRDNE